jgi:serine/threonine-protein kinase
MLEDGFRAMPGFNIRRKIGAGAFGQVWDAYDPAGRVVALKFLDCRAMPPSIVASEIRVLRSLGDLHHANIIELFNVYSSGHYIILSMERADGNLEDLRQDYQAETRKNIPADHLLDLLGQAAEGLDFLAGLSLPCINPASTGLQHCDVKPTNLLLKGDTLKIADFGLCAGTSWTTHHKGWRGTVPYAAPELFHGQPVVGTDQFALAITYLKLSLGDRAFLPYNPTPAPTAPPLTMPVDLTKVRIAELPVLARALATRPSARWPSCRQFIAELRQAVFRPRPSGARHRAVARGVGSQRP